MNTRPGNKYKLEDLIDIRHFQDLQDRLFKIYPFASAVIDNDGNILTATAWQDICTHFHRKNKECEKACIQSDKYITEHLEEANPAITYQCPHGLVDNAIPIIIDGIHYGNFFTGQFLVEKPDMDIFREQANRFGFPEEAYLDAARKVPICSKEQLNSYLTFFKGLIDIISEIGLKNLKEIEAKKQIQESEEKYRQLFETMRDAYASIDMKGNIIDANKAFSEMLGYSLEELRGLTYENLTPENWHTFEFDIVEKQVLHRGYSDIYEKEYIHKNGTAFPVELRTFLIKDKQGTATGMWAIVRDISDRKKAEELLINSEKKHRTILQTAIDGFMLIDINGNLREVNDAYCKMSGYSREELLKMNAGELEAVEPSEEVTEKVDEIIDKKTLRFIRQHKRKDGSLFDVEISTQFQPEEGFVCFLRDITESRQLEESLSKSIERLDLATSAAQLGIWDWDMKNNKLIWDDGMYSLYGIHKNDNENVYVSWWNSVHPEDRESIKDVVDSAIRKGGEYDIEFRILQPDKTMKYIKAVGKIFKDSSGEPLRMIGVSYDITQNKEMEFQLQQAQKMESIGTLAGGIAHDFNNILSPIMMHAEMGIADLPPDDPLQHSMKEIFYASERARDLVKQILTFARKRTEKRIPVQTSRVIKEAIKFLRSTIPATISIQHSIKSKNDTVLADQTQLNQIVMNLCTNAAHAMRETGGLLEVILDNEDISISKAKLFLALKPGSYLKLSVKDSGTGISPDILGRIFEPYYTTKKVGEGTGLGLATVHGIVQNYGGDITVESKVGQGTTFNVYLPLIDADISDVEGKSIKVPTGTEEVLLVDDEKAAIDIIKKMLERLGYKVTSTTNSLEAYDIFQRKPDAFDLVITDMTMPDMTGDTLAKEMIDIQPGIKVILCTGFSDKIDEEAAKRIGISSYVMKPIVMSELAKTIREVLDNTE